MIGNSEFKFIAEELRRDIEDHLSRVALLCRVFARGKDPQSLADKLAREPGKYSSSSKKIQDAIGIRVACYFSEDIEIVKRLLCSKYEFDDASSTIDTPHSDQFTVSRYNLIFRLTDELARDFSRAVGDRPIDACFEVQLRSVLSEGWHEVEHDLRYKTKSHWDDAQDLSRALNGIVATLETSEWSMKRVFDDLAYRHYKHGGWSAMLHSKLRMRVKPVLSAQVCEILDADSELAKQAFRIDRDRVITALASARPRIPVTLDNLLYIGNTLQFGNSKLHELTPQLVCDALSGKSATD